MVNNVGVNSEEGDRTKLIYLSNILKLGHEAFRKVSFESLLLHIVNNSRLLFPYRRSSVIGFKNSRSYIYAVSGESKVNQHSTFCTALSQLISAFKNEKEGVILDKKFLQEKKCPQPLIEMINENFDNSIIILLPLLPPDDLSSAKKEKFFFFIECSADEKISPQFLLYIFRLLAEHYSEALFYILRVRKFSFSSFLSVFGIFRPEILMILIFIGFVISLFTIEVRQKALADFEFTPEKHAIVYAPFSGILRESFFNPGDYVSKDDTVLKYDTEKLLFDKMIAEKKLGEIKAKIFLAEAKSFSDVKYRGEIKILRLKREQEENKLKKYDWYLQNSIIKAPIKGTLLIPEKYILAGKKINAGDKLFEIISKKTSLVKAFLNEKDAAVLKVLARSGINKKFVNGKGKSNKQNLYATLKVVLYPHINPEKELETEILSITPIPVLVGNNRFCYIIKLRLKSDEKYVCGMRGVASFYGEEVPLGYYLFRSIVMWWRKIGG